MSTKTIKTILFASLIAAMVIPFSVMDTANATVLGWGDKTKPNVSDKIDDLVAEYNALEAQRVELVSILAQTEPNSEDAVALEEEIVAIEVEQAEISSEIEKLVEQEKIYAPTVTGAATRAIPEGTTITFDRSHRQCDDWSVYMYSSGAGNIGIAAPNSGASISWVTANNPN